MFSLLTSEPDVRCKKMASRGAPVACSATPEAIALMANLKGISVNATLVGRTLCSASKTLMFDRDFNVDWRCAMHALQMK
jgi:hypothetical protein